MRVIGWSIAVLLALAVLYLTIAPVPIDPAPWSPTPNAGFAGPFAPDSTLSRADTIPLPGSGPEDLALGPDGFLYTGLVDGRIVRIDRGTGAVHPFADTDGRPLGLRFDSTGNLIVADAIRGVLAVSPRGTVTELTKAVGGTAFRFTDAVDVAPDGTVWFSDASRRWGVTTGGLMDFWESRPSGRLLRYDPGSKETRVAIDSIDFANGVAVGPAGAWVVVNETMTGRILRLWLAGPRAGRTEVFVEGLPGMPDNIWYDGRGTFWVGLFGPRTPLVTRIRSLPPFLRKIVYRVPESLRPSRADRYGMIVGIDTLGRIRHNLQDPSGRFHATTAAIATGDTVYVGSLVRDVIARVPLPPVRPVPPRPPG